MKHRFTKTSACDVGFRRHTIALALASALGLSGPACAFEIPDVHPDLEMRWDNTFRYNLGGRAQSQNPAILGAPNNDDGDRNFSNGSLVTNRLDILSEFDVVWQKSYGARVQRRAVVRQRVQQPRQQQHRDREHAGQRPAGGRAAVAVHQALRQGTVGRVARRVRLRQLRHRSAFR